MDQATVRDALLTGDYSVLFGMIEWDALARVTFPACACGHTESADAFVATYGNAIAVATPAIHGIDAAMEVFHTDGSVAMDQVLAGTVERLQMASERLEAMVGTQQLLEYLATQ